MREEQLLPSLQKRRALNQSYQISERRVSMDSPNLTGGCACRSVRYRLTASPLIVHACHCRDCQRITGSAFVINLWIERQFVEAGPAMPKSFQLAGGSGQKHDVFFCDSCGTYLW